MKEDIEMLEKIIKQAKGYSIYSILGDEEIQAIENLIKAYKELEENCKKCVVRERLSEYVENSISKDKLLKTIDFSVQATDTNDNYSVGMCNGMLYIKSVILDKDIEYKKCSNNSISKDKIREKINEIENVANENKIIQNTIKYKVQIAILKELLEE